MHENRETSHASINYYNFDREYMTEFSSQSSERCAVAASEQLYAPTRTNSTRVTAAFNRAVSAQLAGIAAAASSRH